MKRKMFLGIAAVAVAVVSGYNVYQARTSTKGLSDLALANVEALARIEIDKECPDPYDIVNHIYSFEPRTGTFHVDVSGEINIAGKKIKLGGIYANLNVTVTYEIGNCEKTSPGNCCPISRVGEIKYIGLVE